MTEINRNQRPGSLQAVPPDLAEESPKGPFLQDITSLPDAAVKHVCS